MDEDMELRKKHAQWLLKCEAYPDNVLSAVFGEPGTGYSRINRALDAADRLSLVETAFEQLSEDQRKVMLAVFRDRKSDELVQAELGFSPSEREQLVARALRTLRHPSCSRQLSAGICPFYPTTEEAQAEAAKSDGGDE